jgi:predicted phage tail protein
MSELGLAISTVLRGAGGGGSSAPRAPIESPDSLRSISYARILDLIGEGEIYGFSDQANPLSCVYLNETPVANADGSLNFKNIQVDSRVGTQVQDYIQGFDGVESEIGIGVELRSDVAWTRAITNLNLNALRVRLSVPALSKANTSNGDITGYRIAYRIELQTDGGSFVTKLDTAFSGKTSSKYERTHRIDLTTATTGWTLRVVRVTVNADSSAIQDTMVVESYAEIIDAKLRMPMSALVSVVVDAEQFNNIPSRAYRVKGRIIRVPSNYNPETRVYTGLWDGTFQPAWSDNPAWVFYDMALNTRYGLGHIVPQDLVDKWTLYRIAQYCDTLVPDGLGGMEPRFTCNICFQAQNDALRVMQDLSTVFRGIIYATGNTITAVADMPEDAVYTYSPSNVLGGKFTYSGSSGKVRHTVALVSYTDMTDFGRAKVEYVDDPDGIARYGIQQTEIIAVGCSSRGQARRWGAYLLVTERYETDACSWGVGLDGTVVAPGKIVKVADPLRAGARTGGRISNATSNSVVVDMMPAVAAGDTLVVILPDGTSEERTVLSALGKTITVTTNFSAVPVAQSQWAVESEELALQQFRILSVTELTGKEKGYGITAIQHVPGKFAFVDTGVMIEEPPIAPIPPQVVPSPTGLLVTARDVVEQNTVAKVVNLSWNPVPVATTYKVQWRMSDGSWVTIEKIGTHDTDLIGVGAGEFEVQVIAIDVLGRMSLPTFGGPYSIDTVQSPPGFVNDINDQFVSITAELDTVEAAATQMRTDIDAAIAQVQTLQGQVGDILQADEWDDTKAYVLGDLVQATGKLYRAIQDVPIGTAITDDTYWEFIGNYASLGEAVAATAAQVAVNTNSITQTNDDITALSQTLTTLQATVDTQGDDLAAQNTHIDSVETKADNNGLAIQAVATDVSLLGASNGDKSAFNLNSNTVKIDGTQTMAQTLSGLQAADAAVNVRVDNEQTARIDGDSANATAITAVQAQLADAGNLLSKGVFEDGIKGAWDGTSFLASVGPTDFQGHTVLLQASLGIVDQHPFPVHNGDQFDLSGLFYSNDMGAGGNVQFFLYVTNSDGSNTFLTVPSLQVTAANTVLRLSGRVTITNALAQSARGHIQILNNSGGSAVFTELAIKRVTVAEKQNASAVTALIANVGPGGAYAQATTMLDVNGRITGVSQTNNGVTGDFKILADKFSIESPAGGARTEYSAGNWRVYDSAGVLRVRMGIW